MLIQEKKMFDGFIDTLAPKEKYVFIKTLLYMVKIDGKIEDEERKLAHELIKIYDAEKWREELKKTQTKNMLLEEIKTTITERKKGLFLLRELLIVAYIDNNFDQKEMSFIEQISQVLKIEPEIVIELNRLILDYKLLQLKSKKIMEA